MIGQAIPLFQSGNLLTKEMLIAMNDYSFGFSELLFKGYGNGILKGCELTTTENTISMDRGLILYEGQVYLMTTPLTKTYIPADELTIFKIQFKDEIRTQNFIYRELEVMITKDTRLKKEDLEICRFKLQAGSRLRIAYKDFEDRETEYDTVCKTYAPFAAYGGSSISPEITMAFAKALGSENMDNPVDLTFCLMALNSNGMALTSETIGTYLMARLGVEVMPREPHELFKGLCRILNDVQGDTKEEKVINRRRERILID